MPKSKTPVSDHALEVDWPDFVSECFKRLESGKRTYGDKSFDLEPRELIQMIREELKDTANWSFIMDCVLKRMLEAMEAAGK